MTAVRKSFLIPLALLVAILTFLASGAIALSAWPAISDFTKFYASAQQLARGQDPYADVAREQFAPASASVPGEEVLAGNLNPPQVAVLMMPLAALPVRFALQVWAVISVGLGMLGCTVLWHALNEPPRPLANLLWLLCGFLLYFPTLLALQLGQLTFLTFLLLALAWRAVRNGHSRAAGILLGLACSMKLFVGLVVVYFLVRRRWRVVLWAAVTLVVTTLIGALAAGWQSYFRYEEVLATVTWYASGMNASFTGFFYRFLGGSTNQPLVMLPALGRWLAPAAAGASFVLLVWLAWPPTREQENEVDALGIGLAFCFALLISPLGWSYYFPILLIAVYPAWKQNFYGSPTARWMIIAAVALTALPLPRIVLAHMHGLGALMYSSRKFYCAVGLCRRAGYGLSRVPAAGRCTLITACATASRAVAG